MFFTPASGSSTAASAASRVALGKGARRRSRACHAAPDGPGLADGPGPGVGRRPPRGPTRHHQKRAAAAATARERRQPHGVAVDGTGPRGQAVPPRIAQYDRDVVAELIGGGVDGLCTLRIESTDNQDHFTRLREPERRAPELLRGLGDDGAADEAPNPDAVVFGRRRDFFFTFLAPPPTLTAPSGLRAAMSARAPLVLSAAAAATAASSEA